MALLTFDSLNSQKQGSHIHKFIRYPIQWELFSNSSISHSTVHEEFAYSVATDSQDISIFKVNLDSGISEVEVRKNQQYILQAQILLPYSIVNQRKRVAANDLQIVDSQGLFLAVSVSQEDELALESFMISLSFDISRVTAQRLKISNSKYVLTSLLAIIPIGRNTFYGIYRLSNPLDKSQTRLSLMMQTIEYDVHRIGEMLGLQLDGKVQTPIDTCKQAQKLTLAFITSSLTGTTINFAQGESQEASRHVVVLTPSCKIGNPSLVCFPTQILAILSIDEQNILLKFSNDLTHRASIQLNLGVNLSSFFISTCFLKESALMLTTKGPSPVTLMLDLTLIDENNTKASNMQVFNRFQPFFRTFELKDNLTMQEDHSIEFEPVFTLAQRLNGTLKSLERPVFRWKVDKSINSEILLKNFPTKQKRRRLSGCPVFFQVALPDISMTAPGTQSVDTVSYYFTNYCDEPMTYTLQIGSYTSPPSWLTSQTWLGYPTEGYRMQLTFTFSSADQYGMYPIIVTAYAGQFRAQKAFILEVLPVTSFGTGLLASVPDATVLDLNGCYDIDVSPDTTIMAYCGFSSNTLWNPDSLASGSYGFIVSADGNMNTNYRISIKGPTPVTYSSETRNCRFGKITSSIYSVVHLFVKDTTLTEPDQIILLKNHPTTGKLLGSAMFQSFGYNIPVREIIIDDPEQYVYVNIDHNAQKSVIGYVVPNSENSQSAIWKLDSNLVSIKIYVYSGDTLHGINFYAVKISGRFLYAAGRGQQDVSSRPGLFRIPVDTLQPLTYQDGRYFVQNNLVFTTWKPVAVNELYGLEIMSRYLISALPINIGSGQPTYNGVDIILVSMSLLWRTTDLILSQVHLSNIFSCCLSLQISLAPGTTDTGILFIGRSSQANIMRFTLSGSGVITIAGAFYQNLQSLVSLSRLFVVNGNMYLRQTLSQFSFQSFFTRLRTTDNWASFTFANSLCTNQITLGSTSVFNVPNGANNANMVSKWAIGNNGLAPNGDRSYLIPTNTNGTGNFHYRIYGSIPTTVPVSQNGCPAVSVDSTPYFITKFVDQKVSVGTPLTYSMTGPVVATLAGTSMTLSTVVSVYGGVPTWITVTYGANYALSFTFNPTNAELGFHTVWVTSTLASDTTRTAQQFFMINVQPATPYGTSSAQKVGINFGMFRRSLVTSLQADINKNEQGIVLCGLSTDSTFVDTSISPNVGFMMSLDSDFNTIYMLQVKKVNNLFFATMDSYCKFGPISGSIYYTYQQYFATGSGFGIIKVSPVTGDYQKGIQLTDPSSVEIRGINFDSETEDVYINGITALYQSQFSMASTTSNQYLSFIWKLSSDLKSLAFVPIVSTLDTVLYIFKLESTFASRWKKIFSVFTVPWNSYNQPIVGWHSSDTLSWTGYSAMTNALIKLQDVPEATFGILCAYGYLFSAFNIARLDGTAFQTLFTVFSISSTPLNQLVIQSPIGANRVADVVESPLQQGGIILSFGTTSGKAYVLAISYTVNTITVGTQYLQFVPYLGDSVGVFMRKLKTGYVGFIVRDSTTNTAYVAKINPVFSLLDWQNGVYTSANGGSFCIAPVLYSNAVLTTANTYSGWGAITGFFNVDKSISLNQFKNMGTPPTNTAFLFKSTPPSIQATINGKTSSTGLEVPTLLQSPVNQQVLLSGTLPYVYSVPTDVAKTYTGSAITSSWAVSGFSTPPSWITTTFGYATSQSVQFSMNPTSTDIGLYSITLQFALTADLSKNVSTSFLVEVYPATSLGQPVVCPTNLGLVILGGVSNYIIMDTQVSDDEQTIAVCGYLNQARIDGFVQSINQNYKLNYHFALTTDSTVASLQNQVLQCKFMPLGNLFLGVQSRLQASTDITRTESISLYQYTPVTGQLINAIQLRDLNIQYGDMQTDGNFIYVVLSSLPMGGVSSQSVLRQDSSSTFRNGLIWKLTNNLQSVSVLTCGSATPQITRFYSLEVNDSPYFYALGFGFYSPYNKLEPFISFHSASTLLPIFTFTTSQNVFYEHANGPAKRVVKKAFRNFVFFTHEVTDSSSMINSDLSLTVFETIRSTVIAPLPLGQVNLALQKWQVVSDLGFNENLNLIFLAACGAFTGTCQITPIRFNSQGPTYLSTFATQRLNIQSDVSTTNQMTTLKSFGSSMLSIFVSVTSTNSRSIITRFNPFAFPEWLYGCETNTLFQSVQSSASNAWSMPGGLITSYTISSWTQNHAIVTDLKTQFLAQITGVPTGILIYYSDPATITAGSYSMLSSPMNSKCHHTANTTINFIQNFTDQKVFLNSTLPFVYSLPTDVVQNCVNITMFPMYNVSDFAQTYPSWVTPTFGSLTPYSVSFSFNPSATDVGVYPLTVSYSSGFNLTASQTFIVEVFPSGIFYNMSTCYPQNLFLGNVYSNTQFQYMDIHPDQMEILSCGSGYTANDPWGRHKGFLQSFNSALEQNYMIYFESRFGVQDDFNFCKFGEFSDSVYYLPSTMSQYSTTGTSLFKDTINVFRYTRRTGSLLNQIRVKIDMIQISLQDVSFNEANGEIYVLFNLGSGSHQIKASYPLIVTNTVFWKLSFNLQNQDLIVFGSDYSLFGFNMMIHGSLLYLLGNGFSNSYTSRQNYFVSRHDMTSRNLALQNIIFLRSTTFQARLSIDNYFGIESNGYHVFTATIVDNTASYNEIWLTSFPMELFPALSQQQHYYPTSSYYFISSQVKIFNSKVFLTYSVSSNYVSYVVIFNYNQANGALTFAATNQLYTYSSGYSNQLQKIILKLSKTDHGFLMGVTKTSSYSFVEGAMLLKFNLQSSPTFSSGCTLAQQVSSSGYFPNGQSTNGVSLWANSTFNYLISNRNNNLTSLTQTPENFRIKYQTNFDNMKYVWSNCLAKFDCNLTWITQPADQHIFLSNTTIPYIYSIPAPVSTCYQATLKPQVSVTSYSTLPSWLQVTYGPYPNYNLTMSFNVTQANIGVHAISVSFTPALDSAQAQTKYFNLEIYPVALMGAPNVTCNYFAQNYHGSFYYDYSTYFKGSDVNADGTSIAVCGDSATAFVDHSIYSSNNAFLQSLNPAYESNFFFTFQALNLQSSSADCKYSPVNGNIYWLVSQALTSTSYNDAAVFLVFTPITGYLLGSTQLSIQGYTTKVSTFYYGNGGLIYALVGHRSPYGFYTTSYQDFFIWVLDHSLATQQVVDIYRVNGYHLHILNLKVSPDSTKLFFSAFDNTALSWVQSVHSASPIANILTIHQTSGWTPYFQQGQFQSIGLEVIGSQVYSSFTTYSGNTMASQIWVRDFNYNFLKAFSLEYGVCCGQGFSASQFLYDATSSKLYISLGTTYQFTWLAPFTITSSAPYLTYSGGSTSYYLQTQTYINQAKLRIILKNFGTNQFMWMIVDINAFTISRFSLGGSTLRFNSGEMCYSSYGQTSGTSICGDGPVSSANPQSSWWTAYTYGSINYNTTMISPPTKFSLINSRVPKSYQIGYGPCTGNIQSPVSIIQQLQNQNFSLSQNLPFVYNVTTDIASNPCGQLMLTTISVDTIGTFPTWINATYGITTQYSASFKFTPTASNIGLYSIRLKYALQANSAMFNTTSFMLEIYPASPMTLASPNQDCSDFYPANFQRTSVNTKYMDVSSDGQTLVQCGLTTDSAFRTNSGQMPFMQVMDLNLEIHYFRSFQTSNAVNYPNYCFFAPVSGNVYHMAVTQRVYSNPNSLDIFAFTQTTGKYQGSLSISDTFLSSTAFYQVEQAYAFDSSSDDLYVSFSAAYSRMQNTAGYSGYLLKLDKNLNPLIVLTITSGTYNTKVRNIALDASNLNLFTLEYGQTLGYDPQNYILRKFTSNTLAFSGNQINLKSTSAMRITIPLNDQDFFSSGIIASNDFVYTALPTYQSVTGAVEIWVTCFDSNLNLLKQIEYNGATNVQSTSIVFAPTTNYLVVGVSYTDYWCIFFQFITSATSPYLSEFRVKQNSIYYYRSYKNMLKVAGSTVFGFTVNDVNGYPSWIVKMQTGTTPSTFRFIGGFSNSNGLHYQQYMSSDRYWVDNYFKPPSGLNGYGDSLWSPVTVAWSFINNTQFIDPSYRVFYKAPTDIFIRYADPTSIPSQQYNFFSSSILKALPKFVTTPQKMSYTIGSAALTQSITSNIVTNCKNLPMTPTWGCDTYQTCPFLTATLSSTFPYTASFTVGTSATSPGLWTVFLKYALTSDSSVSSTVYFQVEVYPSTPYGLPTPANECNYDRWPMIIDNNPGYRDPIYLDISQDELTIAVCGRYTQSGLQNFGTYWMPVLSSFNQNFYLNWHISFTRGTTHMNSFYCQFGGPNQHIFYTFGSIDSVSTQTVNIFKFSRIQGKYQASTAITDDGYIDTKKLYVHPSNTDENVYVILYIYCGKLGYARYACLQYETLLWKLDVNLNTLALAAFGSMSRYYFTYNDLLLDSTGSYIYGVGQSHLSSSSTTYGSTSFFKIQASNLNLADARVNLKPNTRPLDTSYVEGKPGIAKYGNYFYTSNIIYDTSAATNIYEVIFTQWDPVLMNPVIQVHFSTYPGFTGSTVSSSGIQSTPILNRMMGFINIQGYFYLFVFQTSGTSPLLSVISYQRLRYLQSPTSEMLSSTLESRTNAMYLIMATLNHLSYHYLIKIDYGDLPTIKYGCQYSSSSPALTQHQGPIKLSSDFYYPNGRNGNSISYWTATTELNYIDKMDIYANHVFATKSLQTLYYGSSVSGSQMGTNSGCGLQKTQSGYASKPLIQMDIPMQKILIPATGSWDSVSAFAINCWGDTMTYTFSMGFGSNPSWITLSTGPAANQLKFSFTPAASDIGLYSVTVNVQSSNSGLSTQSNFVIEVYPATAYGQPYPPPACNDVFSAILGNQPSTQILSTDVSSDGNTFAICGVSTSWKYTYSQGSGFVGFIQSVNQNLFVNFHLSFHSSYNYIIDKCIIGWLSGNIYSFTESSSSTSTYRDLFSIFKHASATGSLQKAIQLSLGAGIYSYFYCSVVNPQNEDVYVLLVTQSNPTFSVDMNAGDYQTLIWKVNSNLANPKIVAYSQDFSYKAQGNGITIDSTSSSLYLSLLYKHTNAYGGNSFIFTQISPVSLLHQIAVGYVASKWGVDNFLVGIETIGSNVFWATIHKESSGFAYLVVSKMRSNDLFEVGRVEFKIGSAGMQGINLVSSPISNYLLLTYSSQSGSIYGLSLLSQSINPQLTLTTKGMTQMYVSTSVFNVANAKVVGQVIYASYTSQQPGYISIISKLSLGSSGDVPQFVGGCTSGTQMQQTYFGVTQQPTLAYFNAAEMGGQNSGNLVQLMSNFTNSTGFFSIDKTTFINSGYLYGTRNYGFPSKLFGRYNSTIDSFATSYLTCSSIAKPYPEQLLTLSNQVVTGGNTGTYSVGGSLVSNCMGSPMTPLLEVKNYVTLPSFVSVSWGGSYNPTFTFATSSADIGLYSVNLTYFVTTDPSLALSQTFLLEIRPSTPFGQPVPTPGCNNDTIFPATFYALNTWPLSMDISDDEGTYSLCGFTTNSSLASITSSIQQAFVQSINNIYQMNYHYAFKSSGSGMAAICRFTPITQNLLVQIVTTGSQASVQNQIQMLIFSKITGQFISGTQIQDFTNFADTNTNIEFNPSNGQIYASIYVRQSQFQLIPANPFQSLIWKLDANLNTLGLFTYGYIGQTGDTFIPSLKLDSSASNLYVSGTAHSTVMATPNQFVAKIECYNHSINAAMHIEATSITRHSDVWIDNVEVTTTNVYSAVGVSKAPTFVNVKQIWVTAWDLNLNYLQQYQLDLASVGLFKHCIKVTKSDKLVLSVNYPATDSTQESIFTFTISSSAPYLTLLTTSYLKYQSASSIIMPSIKVRNGGIYLILPGNSWNSQLHLTKIYHDQSSGCIRMQFGCRAYVSESSVSLTLPFGITDGDLSNRWIDFKTQISSQWKDTLISTRVSRPTTQVIYSSGAATPADMPSILTTYGSCSPISSPNQLNPMISDYLGANGFTVSTGSYTILLRNYQQCQSFPITYNILVNTTSLPPWIVYDPLTPKLEFFPNLNSLTGLYLINISASVYFNTIASTTYSSFYVEIKRNLPPEFLYDWAPSYTMIAHKVWSRDFYFDYDVNSDSQFFSTQILYANNVSINPQPTWFIADYSISDQVTVTFDDPPQPANLEWQIYWIQINMTDIYNYYTPKIVQIPMNVTYNKAPYMKLPLVNFTLDEFRLPRRFEYKVYQDNFTDDEGDQIFMACNVSSTTSNVDSSWISFPYFSGNGTQVFTGTTPRNQSVSGNYTFLCAIYDQWDGFPTVYTWGMRIYNKLDIIPISPGNFSTRVPNKIEIDMSNGAVDPQGEPFATQCVINGSDVSLQPVAWGVWNPLTSKFAVDPYSNDFAGNWTAEYIYNDLITPVVSLYYNIEIVPDYPLIIIKYLDDKDVIVGNYFQFEYNLLELFRNPEPQFTFTMYFRQKGTNPPSIPYFITKNYTNGTLGGIAGPADVGSYQMECVGIDDAFWETVISFKLSIKRIHIIFLTYLACYYKCSSCWSTMYDACLACHPGYYKYGTECVDFCPDGTFLNSTIYECQNCPNPCKTCFGNDELNQCTSCSSNYFYLNKGCYSTCPDAYFGDTTQWKCICKTYLLKFILVCNPACSICFGSSSTQCRQCRTIFEKNDLGDRAKSGYLLVGTACIKPKCAEGQFFKWNTLPDASGNTRGFCMPCSSRCRTCINETDTSCVLCPPGYQMQSNNFCKRCEETVGLFTNAEMNCQEICGDGILLSTDPLACDDGNEDSGDGCSSKCVVEYGYACKIPGKPCKISIQPQFFAIQCTAINLIYIQFSKQVKISNETDISESNIEVEITGPQPSYLFTWRVLPYTAGNLQVGTNITKFMIILEDFQQTMTGSEIAKISFKNYSGIEDMYQNSLVNNSYAQINVYPFTYVSPQSASAVAGSGTSLKYTFLSVFGFNFALKVVMNGSMQYLWGLVHALQVFNILLLINITFPKNIASFSKYLSIASADSEEINQYIPDTSEWLINVEDLEEAIDLETLPQKFQDNGIPAYFVVGFGKKITMWLFAFCICLPAIALLHKVCKKVKLWENLIAGFFWNLPLRTIIEMYMELVVNILINTKFIKFKNYSQAIATLMAFICATFALLLPFLTMSIMYHFRKQVRKTKFTKKFGMLTEEVRQKSITQLYYFPLFMYQRLVICAIIVYLQSYPLIQCLLVMMTNAFMIGYLIATKPFKEENKQTTTVIDELVIMLCVGVFIVIYMKSPMDESTFNSLGWVIIALIMFSVIKNFVIVIYFGFLGMQQKLQAMFQAEDQQLDSPNSSEINRSDSIESIDSDEVMEDPILKQQIQKARAELKAKVQEEEAKAQANYPRRRFPQIEVIPPDEEIKVASQLVSPQIENGIPGMNIQTFNQ